MARLLRLFSKSTTTAVSTGALLLEDGSYLLLEDGSSHLLLER